MTRDSGDEAVSTTELARAYRSWDAHVEIAISAALGTVLVLTLRIDISAVRVVALPINGVLLLGVFLRTDASSLPQYLLDLDGLKQVTVASVPSLIVVHLSGQDVLDLLQLSYWVFGMAALGVVVFSVVAKNRQT